MPKPKQAPKRKKTQQQKKVPDYRHDMISIIEPFTEANMTPIIKKYNLQGTLIAICEKLNNDYKVYRLLEHVDNKTPKTKQQKEYMEEIEITATRLRTLIEKMSYPVAIKLIRAIPTDPNKNVFGELKDRLLKDLKELENRAYFANYKTPKDKSGTPSKALKSLFWRLADIYEEHTNCKPCIKNYKKVIKGKFFDFLSDFIEISKIPIFMTIKASTIRDVLNKRKSYKEQAE